jgi:hypothetical protein
MLPTLPNTNASAARILRLLKHIMLKYRSSASVAAKITDETVDSNLNLLQHVSLHEQISPKSQEASLSRLLTRFAQLIMQSPDPIKIMAIANMAGSAPRRTRVVFLDWMHHFLPQVPKDTLIAAFTHLASFELPQDIRRLVNTHLVQRYSASTCQSILSSREVDATIQVSNANKCIQLLALLSASLHQEAFIVHDARVQVVHSLEYSARDARTLLSLLEACSPTQVHSRRCR